MKYFIVLSLLVLTTPSWAQRSGPTPVFVAPVKLVSFVDETEALGSLQANENVELAATVNELITKVNFEDGQRVKQGDVLVEMDAAEELAEKAEERSRLLEAERQVKRLEPLIARGAASASALDESQLELQIARARLSAIESRIRQRTIVAPFDGIVGLRNVSVGAFAQPGTLMTTIDDDTVMKLDFSVPELFLSTLKPGINIVATSSAYPDETFTGTLASVDSRVNPVTRAIVARALLQNAEQRLKPGMLMQVVLEKNPRNTLVVPEEAIESKGDQASVYVVQTTPEGTKAARTLVTLGARQKGEVEVLTGLEMGQHVIVHGGLRVRDGASVVVNAVEKNNETLTELLQQKNGKQAQ